MENNITKTGLGHKYAFWFILITTFLICIVSLIPNAVNVAVVVPSYIAFATATIGIITGSKSYSNKLKTNIEKDKTKQEMSNG